MRCIRLKWPLSIIVMATVLVTANPSLCAETLIFHASQSGKQTLDQGEGGGNPFASALIDLLKRPSLTLSQLPAALQRLTAKKSGGFQLPDVPTLADQEDILLVPPTKHQHRIALVMVVSDYRQSGGAKSLPGASRDAKRIALALNHVGFKTEIALDLDLQEMRGKLANYRKRSLNADAAVIYTTGHGVEVNGTVFLLPGDYPVNQRNAALTTHALSLPEITRSPGAKIANLIFYAGCRDNPFGK